MKKKVLFVVHQMNYGGVQKALIPALNAIDYEENEVTVYVRKNRTQLIPNINKNVSEIIVNQDKTHYYRKPYMVMCLIGLEISNLLKNKKWYENIRKKMIAYLNEAQMRYEKKHYFCDQKEYDVAVSYIQGYTAQFVAEYINARKKIMFFHVSTDEIHEVHERVMPKFDKVVGVNKNIQDILAVLYPVYADKMTYLENYVDTEEIRVKSQEFEVPKKAGKINLCTCGRLTTVKGFDFAVEAAKQLKEKQIPFFWYFIGDGPERERLEAKIHEYDMEDDIKITGMQDNPYPYIAGCDIYVQSSREEAHPLTIMEALRLNRPVVSTATVGGNFLIETKVNGILVDINGEAIAEGIASLCESREIFNDIKENLERIDYSLKFEEYKQGWKEILSCSNRCGE